MNTLRTATIKLAHANPELRPHLLPILAEGSPKQAKLMARQEAILKAYLESVGSQAAMSYDDLPAQVRAALERVKDQETLWSDAERYLSDYRYRPRWAATTKVAHRPYLWAQGLTKDAVRDGKAAMLYFIDLGRNHSKAYEMVIREYPDGTASLTRKWGALTDSERTGNLPEKTDEFGSLGQAQRALRTLYAQKTAKGYIDAFGPRHVTPDGRKLPIGEYPVGLDRNVGFGWGTQTTAKCSIYLKQILVKIEEAKMLTDRDAGTAAISQAVAQADALVKFLVADDNTMGTKVKAMIRNILGRLQGQGRYLEDETGVQMVRDLNTLTNYLSKQLSLCNS